MKPEPLKGKEHLFERKQLIIIKSAVDGFVDELFEYDVNARNNNLIRHLKKKWFENQEEKE